MARQLTFDLALPPPTYAREDFVVADGNREALAWIDRWPDWPAPALALGGPPGCGKTHLLRIWAARAGALPIHGKDLEGKSVADLSEMIAASPTIAIDDAQHAPERALFGFVGVLIAVPMAAVVGVLVRHLIGRYRDSQYYRGADAG